MASYSDLLSAVESYYGSESDQWYRLSEFGIDNPESIQILRDMPGVDVTTANDGSIIGWDFSNAFPDSVSVGADVNSNVQSGIYGTGAFNANVNGTVVTDPQTGVASMSSGARGLLGTVATVADKIGLAYAGVSLGTKLGKAIDSALYNISPQWWDDNFPYINPQTWDTMATTDEGKQFIRGLFGLSGNSNTLYLDERMLAYTYMLMQQNGAWSSGGYTPGSAPTTGQTFTNTDFTFMTLAEWVTAFNIDASDSQYVYNKYKNYGGLLTGYRNGVPTLLVPYTNDVRSMTITSSGPYTVTNITTSVNKITATVNPSFTIRDNQGGRSFQSFYRNESGKLRNSTTSITTYNTVTNEYTVEDSAATWTLLANLQTVPALEGVTDDSRAQTHINPNLITGTTPDEVLQQLKQQYPDLFTDSVNEIILQPDGTTKTATYIPVPQPVPDTTGQMVTGTTSQNDTAVNPTNTTEMQLQQLTNTITDTVTPPDTGTGNTPVIPTPTGSANALFSIYNPSQSQLNSFGAWLWSNNFVDQLLKLFNDPMQSIIGLHKVFVSPSTSGSGTIHVGYLDSGVSSAVVGGQYTSVDCGTVAINEYYGNVFDYSPYTQISLYLPFVGIVPLDSGDVMRSKINVVYHVDVITGACLAEIRVKRDGENAILYTYSGNCAVQYPTSSGSYMGIVGALAATVGTVASAIATGGATAPMAIGAASSLLGARTQVSKSGAFSGNAGAMGAKKPYIIISRIQPNIASTVTELAGKPANKSTQIKKCNGFIKCRDFVLSGIPATETELNEIAGLLSSGIYV